MAADRPLISASGGSTSARCFDMGAIEAGRYARSYPWPSSERRCIPGSRPIVGRMIVVGKAHRIDVSQCPPSDSNRRPAD